MKAITRLASIAAALTLALNTVALSAPKAERAKKYFTVAGTVLKIDKKDRTLLVADRFSKNLYLIAVPEGVTFKITFGRYMRMAEPGFENVFTKERVEIRCIRSDKEHLAQLEDGRSVIVLTATS